MGDATACVEDDCTNKPAKSGRGFCHKHYLAKLDDGSLPRIINIPVTKADTCSVAGCDERSRVKSFCRSHYHRWLSYGDPAWTPTPKGRSTCSIDDCNKIVNGQGLCGTHYSRLRRFGSTAPRTRRLPIERFHEQVDASAGPDGCHLWTGTRDPDGYGMFYTNRAHRATRWILGYQRGEPLATDEWALHHCDNPPCVNPDHLYVGDSLQNVADRVRRGRSGKRGKSTHCPNGHEYTPENSFVEGTKRKCVICNNARLDRRYEKARRRKASAA
jgi:hypothetical protein